MWGRLKADWLGRFLILKNGIPSQDTFLRVFRVLDPNQFESAFRRWVGGIVRALDGHVAVDGKKMCRSADGDAPPVHMVSAFSTGLGLVLGQEKVAGKSNELRALPELLDALHLKGLLVSIDAQECLPQNVDWYSRRLPRRASASSTSAVDWPKNTRGIGLFPSRVTPPGRPKPGPLLVRWLQLRAFAVRCAELADSLSLTLRRCP